MQFNFAALAPKEESSNSGEEVSKAAAKLPLRDNLYFQQGRRFLAECQWEEAIAMFNSLTQQCEAEHGPQSIEYAAALYEYGNALLTKEELSPSNNLLAKETLAKDQSGAGQQEGEVK